MKNPKRIVEEGYDLIALDYFEWSDLDPSPARLWFLGEVIDRIPEGSDVLEIGCGSGVPALQELAQGRRVTGLDISASQLERAREHVPDATLIKADVTEAVFPAASFDAVVAFFVWVHIPRSEQRQALHRIARWLRPGGLLMLNMGVGDSADSIEEDWLGVPMFFASFDAETNLAMLREAGFEIELSEVRPEPEDDLSVEFLYVIARKVR